MRLCPWRSIRISRTTWSVRSNTPAAITFRFTSGRRTPTSPAPSSPDRLRTPPWKTPSEPPPRLNSFVADNGLGSGDYVGEKATLASQAAVHRLREIAGLSTRQIGASFRTWEQYRNLAGIDVMTAPPKVAEQLLARKSQVPEIPSRLGYEYEPGLKDGIDPEKFGLNKLWGIEDGLVACVDALERQNVDTFAPEELVGFFRNHGCADFLVHWSNSQIATSREEGKIPRLENWADLLSEGTIGLDSLMNLAGLNSFASDQEEMDNRISEMWKQAEAEQTRKEDL